MRYVLSLAAVAVMAIAGQVLIQSSLQQQGSDARVINLAGRQRMFSQRLAKAAQWPPSPEQRAQLATSLKNLERAHAGLQRGDAQLGLPGLNSVTVQALFADLTPHFEGLTRAVRRLLESPASEEQRQSALALIHQHEGPFLQIMDVIAFRLDDEARQRVSHVERIEAALLLLTLAVLLFEALFIFRPSVEALERSLTSLIRTRDHLARIEADLQATVQAIPDGLARLTGDGRLQILKALSGPGPLGRATPAGSTVNTHELPEPVAVAMSACRTEARASNVLSSRRVIVDRGTTENAYEIRVAPSHGMGNVVMLRDVTEQRRLEAEVLEANEKVQGRVGRELHDGLCQHLAGLALMARARSPDPSTDEFVRLLDEGVLEARQLAMGLYPATLANLGLSGALEEIIHHIETVSDLVCELEIPSEPVQLSDENALQVYRIRPRGGRQRGQARGSPASVDSSHQ